MSMSCLCCRAFFSKEQSPTPPVTVESNAGTVTSPPEGIGKGMRGAVAVADASQEVFDASSATALPTEVSEGMAGGVVSGLDLDRVQADFVFPQTRQQGAEDASPVVGVTKPPSGSCVDGSDSGRIQPNFVAEDGRSLPG
ncbi:MAG: hypothetical protein OXF02_01190 [Simkaniaceae bacterium]|nr:hypothetical protein [Simkaniaceae bacterium]